MIADLEPHVCIRLKQLFPRVPAHQKPPFILDHNMNVCADIEWFTHRYPLEMSDADRQTLVNGHLRFTEAQDQLERILKHEYLPPKASGWREGHGPRPHQQAAAAILSIKQGLLVGDDVGEGKTWSGAAALLLPDALPGIVVCDGHLQKQWADRLVETTTLKPCIIKTATPHSLPPYDVFIFRWTQLQGWMHAFAGIKPGAVIFDEAQELRTGLGTTSAPIKRGHGAKALCHAARYRMGLTATPIYNYGDELWEIMRFLRPELLGSREEFMREWGSGGNDGKIKDPRALGSFMREQHAFVRKEKDGAQRVNRIIQHVDYDEESIRSIDDIARALAMKTQTGDFHARGEAARQLDMLVRKQTGVAKARGVAKLLRIFVEAGRPLIVAAWHREVYDIWLEELADLKPAMFTGSETPAKKEREKKRFLDGDTDIFIISLRSGRGVDGLQKRAHLAVVGELDWSPAVHTQFFGRLDREGSLIDGKEDLVDAVFCVTDDGSDPPMVEMLGLKASEAAQIVDPLQGGSVANTDQSRVQMLVARYLENRDKPKPRVMEEVKRTKIVDADMPLFARAAG